VGAVGAVAGAAALGAAYPTAGTIRIRLASDEMTVAGALFIAPALRHVEDAIPAPASKRSRSG